jgi:L-lactate dehydrogenase complex protein LldG
VAHLVAETGSVVLAAGPDDPRSLSLLPPVHIAIAARAQLVADLFDLFDLFSPLSTPGTSPPSCLTLITGPSKTGDIELKLVTGVHGPGEIHVILCTW